MAEQTPKGPKPPKDALKRLNLGKAFAEHDPVLKLREVFVTTPAAVAADELSRANCFFVGRRGTGKTAIALHIRTKNKNAVSIIPDQFVPSNLRMEASKFVDTRQRPFKSLTTAFKLALTLEVISHWTEVNLVKIDNLPSELGRYRNLIEQHSFDSRLLTLFDDFLGPLEQGRDKDWLRAIKNYDEVKAAIQAMTVGKTWATPLLIDRLDEAWSGDDASVVVLMALMHSCVQLHAESAVVRPLLFLRENIFDRVRHVDNEFARLETSVVSMDWSPSQLLELVERRINSSFTTRWALKGTTWDHFFEMSSSGSSYETVFEYCQHRPRDVITYLSFAIDSALAAGHPLVMLSDLDAAKLRFSENRFKELSDEYAENFPQLGLVLKRFYGLGTEFTIPAIQEFIQLLLVDATVQKECGSWLNHISAPELFVEWLYNLGFGGLRRGTETSFRVLSARSATAVRIDQDAHVVIHPTFRDALQLQDKIVTSLAATVLRQSGILEDLPEGLDIENFSRSVEELRQELLTLPHGSGNASQFEDVVGKVIKLCFYRVLTNPEPRVRNRGNSVIRDWMVSNTARQGFWEVVRQKYGAVQVIWECKNYAELGADDFHQVNYYHTDVAGKFSIIVFRGKPTDHYLEHQRRIATNGGFVLLVGQRDLEVFLRQTQNGKWQETHIQTLYEHQVRAIS